MNQAVRIKGLKYSYTRYTYDSDEVISDVALTDVNLDVAPGSFVAIVGHNGSGKSTLARQINALLLPESGDVFVYDMNTKDAERLWDIRSTAGMVFQNPDNQLVATIVEDDVAFGAENLGIPREEIVRRVDDALEAVNMKLYATHAPHMLSGGQKQRIAIAGVLAIEPKVIIFDESTSMLDPSGRREVLDTALRLNRERGITVLWITHFMDEVLEADTVVVMNGGHLLMQGTPREIFLRTAELEAIGLAAPPMVKLAGLLREGGLAIENTVMTMEEMTDALCRLLPKN